MNTAKPLLKSKSTFQISGFGDSAFGEAFPANDWGNFKNTAWGRRREELKAITSDEEYKAIEKSRLNASIPLPEVIKFTWQALEKQGVGKLSHPRILEPSAGSGRFLGYEPPELAAKSERIAVELDSLTGRILKQMYPNAETYIMGFEKAPIPKESIDVAISNVPFGNYPIFDPSFKKDRKKATGQFITTSLPRHWKNYGGGILAFVTLTKPLTRPAIRMFARCWPKTRTWSKPTDYRIRLSGYPGSNRPDNNEKTGTGRKIRR